MQPYKYKPPRVKTGDLRTQVTFYKYGANDGPLPGEKEKEVKYQSWAKVDNVWMKDMELAKSNGTLSDLTLTIRDPQAEFIPDNKHYISLDAPEYQDKRYNVKQVQPDMQNRSFINVIARLVE
jgi:hypothetical protein